MAAGLLHCSVPTTSFRASFQGALLPFLGKASVLLPEEKADVLGRDCSEFLELHSRMELNPGFLLPRACLVSTEPSPPQLKSKLKWQHCQWKKVTLFLNH
jgi:hypothetical protein